MQETIYNTAEGSTQDTLQPLNERSKASMQRQALKKALSKKPPLTHDGNQGGLFGWLAGKLSHSTFMGRHQGQEIDVLHQGLPCLSSIIIWAMSVDKARFCLASKQAEDQRTA